MPRSGSPNMSGGLDRWRCFNSNARRAAAEAGPDDSVPRLGRRLRGQAPATVSDELRPGKPNRERRAYSGNRAPIQAVGRRAA